MLAYVEFPPVHESTLFYAYSSIMFVTLLSNPIDTTFWSIYFFLFAVTDKVENTTLC
jgi:hypothetical protein